MPTRAHLDAALADRPATLVCFDGHSSWVNTKALEAARITTDTPNPRRAHSRVTHTARRTACSRNRPRDWCGG